MQQYTFQALDPRPTPEAAAANEDILSGATMGVEVTIPELAGRLTHGNIDPQHAGGLDTTAVEASLGAELPPPGTTLVTVRPDLDSVAAMAVLDLRQSGGLSLPPEAAAEVIARIKDIAVRDSFSRGGWPGPKPFPSPESPWGSEGSDAPRIGALAAAIADFRVPLGERVEIMRDYLIDGRLPSAYEERVQK